MLQLKCALEEQIVISGGVCLCPSSSSPLSCLLLSFPFLSSPLPTSSFLFYLSTSPSLSCHTSHHLLMCCLSQIMTVSLHTLSHTYTYTYKLTHTHRHTHTHAHTQAHTQKHTHLHTHTNTLFTRVADLHPKQAGKRQIYPPSTS